MTRTDKDTGQNEKSISVPDALKLGKYKDKILVNGVEIEWDTKKGTCTFRGIPVAMMWIDSTLAGLMAGVAAMVGPERFYLALQAEGRKSVESDWLLISSFPDFREGFAALNLNAAVAAWGDWQLVTYDPEKQLCVFRAYNNWEGLYQKALGVCWGSGMLAGKLAGICSHLFKTNCWATQTSFVAKGEVYDEFHVTPSTRNIEDEIEKLLSSDEATRADMAVALNRLKATEISLRHEISERKQAEAELRAASLYTRSLIEASLDPLVTISLEGKITDVNHATEEVTGRNRTELVGTDFSDYFTEPERAREGYRQVFQEGSVTDYPLAIRHREGDITEVLYNASVYRDEGGEVLGVFAAARDITERKQAEEGLHRLNIELEQRVVERTAQLEAANKELEAFSYSVSHDLRAPLRAIDGFSRILLEDYAGKLDDEGQRLLDVVRDNTTRMEKLINDILQFSRTGRLEMTSAEIDMEGLAHSVFEELRPAADASRLQVEIGRLPPARGDHAMLRQVFVNLLSNAIKFSRSREAARIEVGGSMEGEEAVYFVRDNGVGFDMRYVDKLFGVFQRLHAVNEFEGTGIGLAIVKRVIDRHGGRVWAEGKLDEGTTIYFALPTSENGHE